jgi:hypothetical protein
MRWRTPELAALLKESYQTTGILKDKNIYNNSTAVQIVLGTIVFDKRSLGLEDPDPLLDKVELVYNAKSYCFEVWWLETSKMGFPVLFEKIIK